MARRSGSHANITGPRIRAAAADLFARHGYAAVSMRQIAAAVDVQVGTLYLYTPDKQTLLFNLMRSHMEELLDAWRSIPKMREPLVQLENFCRFHISHHLERMDGTFISYMELRNLEPENYAVIADLRRSYEDELEAILKSGVGSGYFSIPDTRLATMALIAMLTGVNTWFRSGGRLNRERVSHLYWSMVRQLVGA